MTSEQAVQTIEALRTGAETRVKVQKEDFLVFRQELIIQPDFKQFRGIARHGGNTEYEYMQTPRS
ncbi:hypothetical protein [Domibacillus enclensis]|uniref:Uncharacterized protein n=1 Tax=Domibacillus enclensis TaxID=1017273 RepID=A0A1N6U022_9BACI|nr:hypothetical protein [Domibacillus enclensis]OXS78400.1 hypothetical protein B1B05_07245 [Domibacillus enclensis]SIQ58897.1 hypothetical protein SAMN05443094_103125 [Domibacillus enclensis]